MKLLITGINGRVGRIVYEHLREEHEVHGLDKTPSDLPRFTQANLNDTKALQAATQGVDAVIHLAADPRPDALWDSVQQNNLEGTRNLLEACKQAGVNHVVLASSVMVYWGYAQQEPYASLHEAHEALPTNIALLASDAAPRPTTPYAVSKAAVEALASEYSAHMRCVCVRIGAVNEDDQPHRYSWCWCSHRDAAYFLAAALRVQEQYCVVTAISDNMNCWVDTKPAEQLLGYEARDCAQDRLDL